VIGLDTNILLRATLNDDPVQSPLAQNLLESLDGQRPGFISIPVMMEFFWVLRSRYKLPQRRLAEIMRRLLEVEHLEFEALETIGKAVATYERGGGDFPDAMIALRNRELGAETTYTFDTEAARRVPSMELLA
jgi:predicted nucleic-acid-binding protein